MALVGYVEILLAILSFLLILGHWYRRNKNEVIMQNWPVIGMLYGFLTKVSRLHEESTKLLIQSGGNFEFKGPYFSNMSFLATGDPMNIQHVLTKNFSNYPRGPDFKEIFQASLGDGIINADSDSWKSQRKLFQALILGSSKFELWIAKSIHQNVVDDLIPVLDRVSETGEQVDFQEMLQRITFDNSFSLVFGFDPFSHDFGFKFPKVVYRKAFEEIDDALLIRHVIPETWWKLMRWLQIGSERQLSKAIELFDELLYKIISLKREKYLSQTEKTPQVVDETNFSMLKAYLDHEHQRNTMDSYSYSDKFLRDSAFNFVGAGISTTNAALTWFFWLVATHPRVETKILEEINQKLPRKDDKNCGFVSPQELNKLVYLQAAICESLRLYPPIPFNHKFATESEILPSGHHVQKNTRIFISSYSMGRMEKVWGKDCLEFKPERWISERGGFMYVPSYKFIAFSTGPRTCLGKNMALIQMKAIAIEVLRNYHVQVVEGHPISPRLSLILYMKHGLKVRVSKRCAA